MPPPRVMEQILHKFLAKICLVYLDDIITFGKNFEEILMNLKEVFFRLQEINLKLNSKKCVLFGKEIKYLGHVISAGGNHRS